MDKLNDQITNLKQTKKLKSFKQVCESERRKRIRIVLNCMELVGGDDGIGVVLLKLLESRRMKPTLPMLSPVLHPQFHQLLSTIRTAHDSAPGHHKRQILSLVSPHFTFKELRTLGFRVHKETRRRCERLGFMPTSTEVAHPCSNQFHHHESGR